MLKTLKCCVALAFAGFALAGCATLPENFSAAYNQGFFASMTPSDDAMQKAKFHFENGDYGIAEQNFRRAVEANPQNAEAWLGLAASYDRLRRFDNANKAYDVVVKLVGFTPTVLNNLGYHYYLRGDMENARKTLIAAQRKDPENAWVQNNLSLIAETEISDGTAPGYRVAGSKDPAAK